MTDNPTPAQMDVRPAKDGAIRRLSLIWIVPVLALLISLGVAYQNYADRGTLIEIAFEDANGVTSGETVIKYRDVEVGRVEDVSFAEGLGEVIVQARIDKEVAPYLDDDANFWVVEPTVNLRGGTQIVFRARDGQALADGAPILHKGIQVGYLEAPELSRDGSSVVANAFVEAPFDQRITSATRFWDTSGFTVSLGTGGVALDVNSIASLIEGGIAFDTVVSGGTPLEQGQIFDIFASEEAARESLFSSPDVAKFNVAVLFENSVSGLTKGSEVRFQGLRVGEVTDLTAVVAEDRDTARVLLRTILAIEPSRIGLGEGTTTDEALSFLSGPISLTLQIAPKTCCSGSMICRLNS